MAFKLLKCPIIDTYCSLYRVDGSCAYPGGKCLEIVIECEGCRYIVSGHCRIYPNPSAKWQTKRGCPRMYRLSELERKRHVTNFQKAKQDEETEEKEKGISEEEKGPKGQDPAKTEEMGRIRRIIKKVLRI